MGIAALRKHIKYEEHLKIAENNDTQMKLSFSSNAKDQSTLVMPKFLTKQKEIIPKIVSSYDVRKAEILLVLQSVVSHISHNSINSFPDLFRLIFPDSNIASTG